MDMTPRARKVKDAMIRIEARGDQPTAGKIQRELGETVKNGGDLSGRDTAVFRETMRDFGYVQAAPGKRWHR